MNDFKRRKIQFDRKLIKQVKDFIPENPKACQEHLVLSRKLLSAYLLCQVNSANYPDSAIDRYLAGDAILPQAIDAFLKKSLEVDFYWPQKMEEGVLYMVFNQETKSMAYTVMNGVQHHTGEIVDTKYQPLKDRLRRRGTLSLREVNFLIEQVIAPRNHVPYFSEVHDPLSLHWLCDFLESDLKAQKDALQFLSPFKPFDGFGFDPPTELVLDPFDREPIMGSLDEHICRYRHEIALSCCDLIKLGGEQ